jgi:hypothetical protein
MTFFLLNNDEICHIDPSVQNFCQESEPSVITLVPSLFAAIDQLAIGFTAAHCLSNQGYSVFLVAAYLT